MSSLRQKMLARQPVLGVSIAFLDPLSVEMAGAIGFDFVVLEFVHNLRDQGQLLDLIRAAHLAGTAVLVRAADLTPNLVGRMLDSGATGIVGRATAAKGAEGTATPRVLRVCRALRAPLASSLSLVWPRSVRRAASPRR